MNIPDKITSDNYTASEFTQFKNETQNAITSSGQSLTGNAIQLKQALARYSANGSSGTDSGSANAYIWAPIGNNDKVTALIDGQSFTLIAGNSNTGASTLTVQGLAAKNIRKSGYSSPVEEFDITAGNVYTFFYSSSNDQFELTTSINQSSGYNLLINPSLGDINQRVFVGGALALDDYGFDRWKSADAATDITSVSGTNTLSAGKIKQIVESDYLRLNGKTLTASITSVTGDYTLRILDNTGSTLASSTTPSVTHTFTGDEVTVSVQIDRISGSVIFDSVKLEFGSHPTSKSPRSIEQEFSLCQRYYWQLSSSATVPGFPTHESTAQKHASIFFPTEMRVDPTIVSAFTLTGGAGPLVWTSGLQNTSTTITGNAASQFTVTSFSADSEL